MPAAGKIGVANPVGKASIIANLALMAYASAKTRVQPVNFSHRAELRCGPCNITRHPASTITIKILFFKFYCTLKTISACQACMMRSHHLAQNTISEFNPTLACPLATGTQIIHFARRNNPPALRPLAQSLCTFGWTRAQWIARKRDSRCRHGRESNSFEFNA
jgi:hypothetical protein